MRNVFFLLMCCFSGFGFSQTVTISEDLFSSKNNLDWGDYYFLNGDYKRASQFYSKNKNELSIDQRRAYAQALQNTGNLEQAIQMLEPILESKEVSVYDLYRYASLLNKNPDKAKEFLERAEKLNFNPENKVSKEEDKKSYKLLNLDLNTDKSEFGATLLNDKSLYYLGEQKKKLKKKIAPDQVYNLYQTTVDIESLSIDSLYELDVRYNSMYQDGPLALDPVSKILFMTRSSNTVNRNQKIQLDLFQIPFQDIEKKVPTPLSINVENFSSLHPTISPDGKRLYFASDRPGGYGGMDLYFVPLKNGIISGEVINLGPDINTAADEVFPHSFAKDVLFYSTRQNAEKKLSIQMAINKIANRWKRSSLAYPFNAEGDNFSFSLDIKSQIGFLSSNRSGGKGDDDIYAFRFNPSLEGEMDTYEFNSSDTLIVGFNHVLKNDLDLMHSKDPLIEILTLETSLTKGVSHGKLVLNKSGTFWYAQESEQAKKDSFAYRIKSSTGSSKDILVELIPKKLDFTAVFRPIYYKYDKSNLEIDYQPRLDSLVTTLNENPMLKVEMSSFADCRGSEEYNLKLTEERNQTILNYVRSRITNPERISGKGYGEGQIINNPSYEYALVIASFKEKNNASSFIEKLPFQEEKPFILESDNLYRVVMEVHDYIDQATTALISLKENGYEGWILTSDCKKSSETVHQMNRKTTFKVTQ